MQLVDTDDCRRVLTVGSKRPFGGNQVQNWLHNRHISTGYVSLHGGGAVHGVCDSNSINAISVPLYCVQHNNHDHTIMSILGRVIGLAKFSPYYALTLES